MENEQLQEKLKFFIKTGIVVLSFLVVMAIGIKYIPPAISVTNSSKSVKLPINSVDKDDNKISLTFDAAYGNEHTEEILNILAKQNVKATFFMTGGWIMKYPDEVKAILAAGHDLGNHSENHKHMSQLSKIRCQDEIIKAHDRVKELTGYEMTLFRPPYGDFDNTVIETANELGYYVVQWDVDSQDWKDYGVDCISETVINHKNLGKGSIISCHNGAKYITQALEDMILMLKGKGYELVPVSELIYTENYYVGKEGRQFKE